MGLQILLSNFGDNLGIIPKTKRFFVLPFCTECFEIGPAFRRFRPAFRSGKPSCKKSAVFLNIDQKAFDPPPLFV